MRIAAWSRTAIFLVLSVAFALTWWTGHRGVYLLDQSMVIDAAWRMLCHQVPYRDFVMPFGPVSFLIQTAFFLVLGVNWTATVVSAAVLNAAAAACAMRIVFLLTNRMGLTLAAGLLMAILFQAPFGTLWIEQTAFFFDFLALQLALEAGRGRRLWLYAGGGLALAAALLSKQNAGMFFVPVLAAVVAAQWLPNWRRLAAALLTLAAGAAAGLAVFTAWLWIWSDPQSFNRVFFQIASEIGRARLTPHAIYKVSLLQAILGFAQWCNFLALMAAAGGVAWLSRRGAARGNNMLGPACAVAAGVPYFQNLFQAFTENDASNVLSLTVIPMAAAAGIALQLAGNGGEPDALPKRLVSAFIAAATLVLGTLGFFYGHYRTAQGFDRHTRFEHRLQTPGMEGVRWGEPTMVHHSEVAAADFENLLAFLRQRGLNFFVMWDSTLLYALAGRTPPQPMLYFIFNHSYTPRDLPALDLRLRDSLERNQVRLIVREKERFMDENIAGRFPETMNWIAAGFRPKARFGYYEVLERE